MSKQLIGHLPHGLLFVISAPAGTGKTTLVERLTQEFPCIVRSISSTTRAPRSGEENGKDYFFLTQKEFDKKLAHGDFLEHAQVFNASYGTSKEFVRSQQAKGKHVVLVIDTQGAMQLKGKIPATFIFISPPSLEELRERLLKRRTETTQLVELRLAWARHELERVLDYDYHIVNDDLETAYTILKSIFIAEEYKVRR